MLKKVPLSFIALLLLLVGYFIYSVTLGKYGLAQFNVSNQANQPVHVVAHGTSGTKDLGLLEPGDEETFRMSGEGSMLFEATLEDKTLLRGAVGYYTTGTEAEIVITTDSIAVDERLFGDKKTSD